MSLPLYSQHPEWKDFFGDDEFCREVERFVTERWISANRYPIHLDIHQRTNVSRGTIVFCHGISICGRILAHLIQPLVQYGFRVICPDLGGFGLSSIPRGTGRIDHNVDDLVFVTRWARNEFGGRVFLAGISLGGALAYYAAARGAQVDALASICLFDFTSQRMQKTSRLGWFLPVLKPILKMSEKIFPDFMLPIQSFLKVENVSHDHNFMRQLNQNPLVLKKYSLGFLASLTHTPPDVLFENFDKVPVLVLHAEQDQLIPKKISIRNYEKIRGRKKMELIPDCGHIPLLENNRQFIAKSLTEWFEAIHES